MQSDLLQMQGTEEVRELSVEDAIEMEAEVSKLKVFLAEVYHPEGQIIWLFHPNKMLKGEIPMDLIAQGRIKEVTALLDALADGAFF